MDLQDSPKGGEHYNLRWNNYTNNLIQVFSEHQHHETLVDVTLICEGQYVKAHKLILSACSGFFQEMFTVHGTVQHPFIILNGIKFNHFKHILEFIYHGEIKVLDADLEGVLSLGESLQVKGLSSVKLKRQAPPQEEPKSVPLVCNSNELLNSSAISVQTSNVTPQNENRYVNVTPSQSKMIEQPRTVESRVDTGGGRKVPRIDKNQTKRDVKEPCNKRIKNPEVKQTINNGNDCLDNKSWESEKDNEKIPRPTNAFMIFANEWRKKLTVEHPSENNKGISVLLGNMWKSLSGETKESYYHLAQKAQLEHQMRYPGYSYSPTEARKRKATRRKTIDSVAMLATVDLQEFENDDDDLQIIEINEDPIDISDSPDKRSRH